MPPVYVDSDSACARLLRLVTKAKSLLQKQVSQQVGFAMLFGVDQKNPTEVYRGIGAFCELIDKARQEVLSHEDLEHDLYVGPVDEVAALVNRISLPGGAPFASVFGPDLSEATVRGLRFTADTISRRADKRVSAEQLAELRAQIDTLDALVKDCPVDLATVLKRCADLLRLAISHYEVYGNKGLQAAVEKAVGAIILNGKTVLPHKNSNAVSAVWDVISKANVLVSLAKNVQPTLTKGAFGLSLLLGGPAGDVPHSGGSEVPADGTIEVPPKSNGAVAQSL